MGIFPFPWSHLLGHPSSHHSRGNLKLSIFSLFPLNYALLEDQLGHCSSPYSIASSLYQLLPQVASIFVHLKEENTTLGWGCSSTIPTALMDQPAIWTFPLLMETPPMLLHIQLQELLAKEHSYTMPNDPPKYPLTIVVSTSHFGLLEKGDPHTIKHIMLSEDSNPSLHLFSTNSSSNSFKCDLYFLKNSALVREPIPAQIHPSSHL